MSDYKIESQYVLLLNFLSECSEPYCSELEKVFVKHGLNWEKNTAQFEIDAYLLSHLCRSVRGHQQPEDVWIGVSYYGEDFLIALHEVVIDDNDIDTIVGDRIEDYSKRDPGKQIERLKQHICSSAIEGLAKSKQPLVIGDFVKEQMALLELVELDMFCVGMFVSALKHIFTNYSDIRTCSQSEFIRLAKVGVDESNNTFREMKAGVKSTSWWKLW